MDLSELGLTGNETKVFEVLLRRGKSKASDLASESGVSYGRIYVVLSSLERKGLVKVIPEKGKKFVASDPELLRLVVDQKRKSLDALEKE